MSAVRPLYSRFDPATSNEIPALIDLGGGRFQERYNKYKELSNPYFAIGFYVIDGFPPSPLFEAPNKKGQEAVLIYDSNPVSSPIIYKVTYTEQEHVPRTVRHKDRSTKAAPVHDVTQEWATNGCWVSFETVLNKVKADGIPRYITATFHYCADDEDDVDDGMTLSFIIAPPFHTV